MRQLLLIAFLASAAWGHCPEFPQLPECPTNVPPPIPRPTTPDPNPVSTLIVFINEVYMEVLAGTKSQESTAFPIAFSGDQYFWRSEVKTDSGGQWLSLTPSQDYGESYVKAVANTAGLKSGTYTGTIKITSPLSLNFSESIRITLRVRDPIPPTVRVNPGTLTFSGREATPSSVTSQRVAITMEGETKSDWTATVTTLNGGNWLAVSPVSGKGDGTITVTPNLTDLPSGAYAGRINVQAPGATNPVLQIPVSFSIDRQKSAVASGGIVNAASLRPGPISPGQLITIAGDRLGPRNGIAARLNESTGRYAPALGGTRVAFDGIAGIVLYASASQINAQVPIEIAGKRTVKMVVEAAGYDNSDPIDVPVANTAPGIFAVDRTRAVVLNQDSSYNTLTSPATAGEIIQLFLTGQGLTTPRIETGALSPSAPPFAVPESSLSVSIGGQPAELVFSGLAPASIGLLQVNARIPASVVPSANVPVSATIGGVTTETLFIAVK